MSKEEDDLYADLFNVGKELEINNLVKELEESKKSNESLTKELAEVKEQLNSLLEEKDRLELNIKAIYDAAQREIDRKDREISDLRAKLGIR